MADEKDPWPKLLDYLVKAKLERKAPLPAELSDRELDVILRDLCWRIYGRRGATAFQQIKDRWRTRNMKIERAINPQKSDHEIHSDLAVEIGEDESTYRKAQQREVARLEYDPTVPQSESSATALRHESLMAWIDEDDS